MDVRIIRAIAVTAVSLLCGCLFTTQSFNRGKLLQPGVSRFGGGVGVTPISEENFGPVTMRDTFYTWTSYKSTGWERKNIRSFSVQYRLGVLEKRPFGNGLEIGWMVQAPVAIYSGYAAVLELDSRFGFNPWVTESGVMYHNVSLGWDIGQWVDNTWFAEYAVGYEHGPITPYFNIRAIAGGTDFFGHSRDPIASDSVGGLGRFDSSKRVFKGRATAGIALATGEIPFVPDYIIPEMNAVFPDYDTLRNVGMSFSLGFQWEFK